MKNNKGFTLIELLVVVGGWIYKSDITDINISTTKRHKELEKDFKKQMKESLPRLKDLVL